MTFKEFVGNTAVRVITGLIVGAYGLLESVAYIDNRINKVNERLNKLEAQMSFMNGNMDEVKKVVDDAVRRQLFEREKHE